MLIVASLTQPGGREGHQGAKKVVSDSPGLVDFAIGLVNSVLNLPDGQAKIFRWIKSTKVLLDKCFKFLINFSGPKVAPTKWNLHKQDEVGALKVKADIAKKLELNVARDYMARHCDQYSRICDLTLLICD